MRDPLREETSLPAPSSWKVLCFQMLFVLKWRWSTPNSIKVTGLYNSFVFPLQHKERKCELPPWSPSCKKLWCSCWIHHECNVDDWHFPDQRILWHFFAPDAVKRFIATCVSLRPFRVMNEEFDLLLSWASNMREKKKRVYHCSCFQNFTTRWQQIHVSKLRRDWADWQHEEKVVSSSTFYWSVIF